MKYKMIQWRFANLNVKTAYGGLLNSMTVLILSGPARRRRRNLCRYTNVRQVGTGTLYYNLKSCSIVWYILLRHFQNLQLACFCYRLETNIPLLSSRSNHTFHQSA